MRTFLLKSYILFLSVAVFSSCDKDDEPIVEKTYKLTSVVWYLDEGDGDVITEEKLPEQIFTNSTNEKKEVTVNPYELFGGETSLFECEEKEVLNKWVGEDFYISIPSFYHNLSSNHSYLVGGAQAVLYAGEEKSIQSTRTVTHSMDLFPNYSLSFNGSIEVKTVIATFIAYFVEDDEQGTDRFEIKGKWTGRLLGGTKIEVVVDEMK